MNAIDTRKIDLISNNTCIKNLETKRILAMLEKGNEQIVFSENEDVVLLLGNTGAGKSILAQHLAGMDDQLEAQEEASGLGQYVIVDKNNRASNTSTITSHTVFPDLVFDTETDTFYYDCPGFNDTRSEVHDIAANYFINKIITSAKSVKLVFVVNYSSVRKGVERRDFTQLVKHAVTFIKNVHRYRNSIALLVTKVDNLKNDHCEMLDLDNKIIAAIARFLEEARKELNQNTEMFIDAPNRKLFYKNAQEFIDILLKKEADQYLKIGIFRRPDKSGVLIENEFLMEKKQSLIKVIHKHLEFTEIVEGDFGFTISAESKNQLFSTLGSIVRSMCEIVDYLTNHIIEHYSSVEGIKLDIDKLQLDTALSKRAFAAIYEASLLGEMTCKEFIERLYRAAEELNMSLVPEHKSVFLLEHSVLEFLHDVTAYPRTNRMTELTKGLKKFCDYLSGSEKWYSFLCNLFNRLSESDVQMNLSKFQTVQLENNVEGNIKFADLDLGESLNELVRNVSGFNYVKELVLDKRKSATLLKLLDQTLNYEVVYHQPAEDTLVVTGKFIKLSDVINTCKENIKVVKIFAVEKVFINSNFVRVDSIELEIMALTWEVVGKRQIVLDGLSGLPHFPPKAQGRNFNSLDGLHGRPGNPGGAGGRFLGIGKLFIRGSALKISANGGNGGNGQDGGDGRDGERCQGGNGGDGGAGGIGGPAGYVVLKELGARSEIDISTRPGDEGQPGQGGCGGKGGCTSTILPQLNLPVYSSAATISHIITEVVALFTMQALPDGNSGSTGIRTALRVQEQPSQPSCHSYAIIDYKKFLEVNLEQSIKTNHIKGMLEDLNKLNIGYV